MKNLITLYLIIFCSISLSAQKKDHVSGKVSYMSSQNIYVKFESTKNLKQGDTLYIKNNDKLVPVLIIQNLSSTSCVCSAISENKLSVSDQIFTNIKLNGPEADKNSKIIIPAVVSNKGDTLPTDTIIKVENSKFVQKITGGATFSSYSYFSTIYDIQSTRFRYQVFLNARNINNSKISAEVNTIFQHEKGNWDTIQKNINQALKIYNLSVKYDNNINTQIVFGRKINTKLSNMGAIDGLQYEGKAGNIFFGAIAGFRPNYTDYSFDFSLPQFGTYFGHSYSNDDGQMQNSFALVKQMNHSETDRRFAYFQHSNSLLKNLYVFGSAEIDLYKNIDNKPENTFDVANAYVVVNYRFNRRLSMGTSYDNRKNVIYYESYKSYINQLLEIEARQGLSFQTNYYNLKNLSIGFKAGYRFPNKNSKETKNFYSYVSYSNIPILELTVTGAVNYIEASYLTGKIFNLNFSRNSTNGNLFFDCGYQFVNYNYVDSETTSMQHIVNLGISWKLLKNTSISVHYETTFENGNMNNRLNFQIRERF